MTSPRPPVKHLHTVAEAAELLRSTPKWLRSRVADRSIPFHRLSPRNTRFSTSDLKDIIARSAS